MTAESAFEVKVVGYRINCEGTHVKQIADVDVVVETKKENGVTSTNISCCVPIDPPTLDSSEIYAKAEAYARNFIKRLEDI